MLYEHYKGGLYRVLAEVARHTETGEDLVVYMSVDTGLVWVRPAELFFGYFKTEEGKEIKRFKTVFELKNTEKIPTK